MRDTRIFDTIEEDGKEKRVLNKKETMLASQKQEAIREAFKDWVFRDPERRQTLCAKYNELFPAIVNTLLYFFFIIRFSLSC